ncbi:hypothetical protein J14TS2_51130 [Bacillus sp. J14TS2]|uniref:glycoside hydrolase family 16 protein n=1 Tax=Bacillus sp. J14TS2 TaxID=2807188 RepID=UPI001B2E12D6|nr:glycoside hydrolase family 16 protein [Bacillus sp. J14TS2]GIN74638.1 hypothetical protein J14TS2_51130 [Bacillus sp. J14TS2]
MNKIEIVDRDQNMPPLLKLKIPHSGYTRRRFRVRTGISEGRMHNLHDVTWSISPSVSGLSIDQEGLLVIQPKANPATIEVMASSIDDPEFVAKQMVEIEKTAGKDIPPNPLEKPGWQLYRHDEFDKEYLDRSIWADQYLRNWSDDIKSKTNYKLEDGAIVVRADIDSAPWSPYDRAENSSITSFEKTYLHRFGHNKYEDSRIIPEFDGFATKYGYFEIRAKLPNTGDGSHVAWWMIGVQDDQNLYAEITDPTIADKRTSNETGEVDIIEIGLDQLSSWRPVMHPNNSTSLEYLHVSETWLDFDPGNEFHIYGFEWDENGTKYYVDNQLVQTTDRTFDYRMMTFLGLYPQGGMGKANRIFPKEFIIDYFRVYKKDEPLRANDIRFEKEGLRYCIKRPEGQEFVSFKLQATVLDQFDEPYADNSLVWQFSETISGDCAKNISGARMDTKTGEIVLTQNISENADLFVTAKVKSNPKVKKTFHIKVSTEASQPLQIQIVPQQKVVEINIPEHEKIQNQTFHAHLLDQYGDKVGGEPIEWAIAEGTTLKDITRISGITISKNGVLQVTEDAQRGSYFFVIALTCIQAKEPDRHSLDSTIYTHQLVKLV